MKKAIIIMILTAMASYVQADTIKMGYFLLRPHMYEENGAPSGAAISYFEAVAKHLGHSVEWQGPLPFPRLVKYLKDGQIDGAQMFSKNDERTQYLYYPQKPYSPVYSVFVLIKDHPLNAIESIDDVDGFRVGFLEGANLSGFIRSNQNKIQIEYIGGVNWIEQNLRKVLSRRLDAAYDINHITVQYEAHKLKIADQLKILRLPEPPMHVYTVFSKTAPDGKKYLDQYNQAFDQFPFSYENFVQKELLHLSGH